MSSELIYKKEKLYSEFLNQERNIFVWIPERFKNECLPVLYLLDGGINEKFKQISKLIDELIILNYIQPLMIVGIENINRNLDFTRNTYIAKDKKWVPEYGNAEYFEKFIVLELLPYISKNYYTNNSKTIVGESLGGLLVMDILFYFSHYFDSYIAIDPSLWWNNHELFDSYCKKFDFNLLENKKIWISSSKTISISKFTDQFVEKLREKDNLKSNWNYLHDPSQNHFTIFNSSIKSALIWMFN